MEPQVPKQKHIWSHLYIFLIMQTTWLQPRHVWPDISKDWLRDEYYSKVLFFTTIFIYFGGWLGSSLKIGEHLLGVWSLLPLRGFWGSNSGSQSWQQTPLPSESPHQTLVLAKGWMCLVCFLKQGFMSCSQPGFNLLQSWDCPGIPRPSTFI